MPWSWNESSHRYHDSATGRFMGRDEVLGYVQQSLDAARTAPAITLADGSLSTGTDLLSNLVGNGMLSPRDWQEQMREEIKAEYIRQYMLGRGGRAQMTSTDWGSIGGMVADQYRYLKDFAKLVSEGKLSEAQIRARAAMYVNSAREGFERGQARAFGLPELPAYPGDGQTICLTNCACSWQIEEVHEGEVLTGWDCFWTLGIVKTEHCDDCLDNTGKWNPLHISAEGEATEGPTLPKEAPPIPVNQEVRNSIQAAMPSLTGDEVEMYMGVMELDRERFIRYADKLGIPNAEELADRFFKSQKEASRQEMRARLAEQAARTLKHDDNVIYYQDCSEEMNQIAQGKMYGQSIEDAVTTLENKYGVTFHIDNDTEPSRAYQEVSWLLNMANANPVLAQALQEQVKGIQYKDRPSGSSAAMQFDPLTRHIFVYPGHYAPPPSAWIHEIGHAAEEYAPGYYDSGLFGQEQGRIVSTYADGKPDEDFAEMFTALVGQWDIAGVREWVPEKYAYMLDHIPGLREMVEK